MRAEEGGVASFKTPKKFFALRGIVIAMLMWPVAVYRVCSAGEKEYLYMTKNCIYKMAMYLVNVLPMLGSLLV